MSEPAEAFPDGKTWPTVSVIMPVRNEAPDLEAAVASILAQDYPLPFDICLAVAPSDDDTEAIATALSERVSRVSVVPNRAGVTPAGLNAAIAATSGDVIVRVDGHAKLSDGYIRRAVETMRRTGAVNVGGIQAARGETPFERAVAAATTSWLGTGGAQFHVGGLEGGVDTVYLGVFDRTAGDQVGWFDESLVRNQDYELNIRLRQGGGTVWFDPFLSVSYRPRGSIRLLARQYFDYGWWKAEVLRRYPRTARIRQIVPAVAPIVLVVSAVTSTKWRPARGILMAYGTALTAGAGFDSLRRDTRFADSIRVYPTIHLAWGTGFLRATFDHVKRRAAGQGG